MKFNLENIPIQIRATIAYIITSLLSQGILFLTTPIFTRIMSTSEMGIVTTYNAWNGILTTVINLSLCSGAFSIAMLEFENDRDKYLSSMLGLSITSTILWYLIYLFFQEKLNKIFTLNFQLVTIMFIGFFLNPARDLWIARKRYEYDYIAFLVISVFISIFSIFISTVSVFYFKNNFGCNLGNVRIISNGLVLSVCSVPFVIYVLRKGNCFFNYKYWKYAVTLNTPLIIHSLSKHILDISDRLMISKICGKSAVGIYGVLYMISSLSIIVWNAINQSMVPYIFSSIKENKIENIKKIIIPILLGYGLISFFLSLVAPELVNILATREYYEAIYIIPPIASGIFLTSTYSLFSTITLYYKKTDYIMSATVIAAVVNVILNYFFIKKFGYIAAAYTTLIAYIILTILQYFFMCKCTSKKIYSVGKVVFISSLVILMNTSCIFLYQYRNIRYIIVIIFLCVLITKRKKIIKIVFSLKK